MNNPDFERTQIWAKNLINTPPVPQVAPPIVDTPATIPPVLPKKPILKILSKEEKIMLATGGALAIGLGAIVITNLPDKIAAPPVPPAASDLEAPVLDLGIDPEPAVLPHEVTPHQGRPHPAPASKTPDHTAAVHYPTHAPDEKHPLLQIPKNPEIALGVDDEVSFTEAFQAAREEVGPAGLFAWRGTYYSTFTEKEWESVPEPQKEHWIAAVQPIIDPDENTLSAQVETTTPQDLQSVVVAERGQITWTGIDKNGDGQAEILLARVNGQPPMVLMDTDGDGHIDTRYDYEAASGKTFASAIDPFPMTTADVTHMEYIELGADMGFYNNSGSPQTTGSLPVSIAEINDEYVVRMDSNMDNTVDAITYLTDSRGPVVGLDNDNDGQIEMGYVYHTDSQTVSSVEMEPMEEMSFSELSAPELSYTPEQSGLNLYQPASNEELATSNDPESDDIDLYFDNDSDLADDYVSA